MDQCLNWIRKELFEESECCECECECECESESERERERVEKFI